MYPYVVKFPPGVGMGNPQPLNDDQKKQKLS